MTKKLDDWWIYITSFTAGAGLAIAVFGTPTPEYQQPPTAHSITAVDSEQVYEQGSTVGRDTAAQLFPEQQEAEKPTEKKPVKQTEPEEVVPDADSLQIPAIDFTLPLKPLNGESGTITPPDFEHGFVLQEWGVGMEGAPSDGSTYVITHSRRDGTGTGNNLFTPEDKQATVKKGETIYALGSKWEIVGWWNEGKQELPKSERLWGNSPDTLYLITCLQIGDGYTHSTDNFIIEAKRVD